MLVAGPGSLLKMVDNKRVGLEEISYRVVGLKNILMKLFPIIIYFIRINT